MPKYPRLFKDQPAITKALLNDFKMRGLLVADNTMHQGERRTAKVTNPTAGEVVGYSILAAKLRDGKISASDARALLAIEATRDKGARETHVSRLISKAYASDKERVIKGIEEWQKREK